MDTKKCNSCELTKTLEEFAWKNKSKNTKSSKCKTCQKAYVAKHYLTNKKTYKKRARKNNVRYKNRNRVFVDSLKTGPCTDCGNCFDPICMDFDHLRDKADSVSSLTLRSYSSQTIVAEIAKCELVCSNCHRIRTKNRRNKRM